MAELTKKQIDEIVGWMLIKYPKMIVAILTADGKYLYASPSHKDILGYESNELLGKNLLDFISYGDLPHAKIAHTDAIFSDISVEFGIKLKKKDSSILSVRAILEIYDDKRNNEKYTIARAWKV